MTEQKEHLYVVWDRVGPAPVTFSAVGPETAAREYAIEKCGPRLHKLVEINCRVIAYEVVVVRAHHPGEVMLFTVTLDIESTKKAIEK